MRRTGFTLIAFCFCIVSLLAVLPWANDARSQEGPGATVTGARSTEPRYIVQVGAFLSQENADRLAQRLATKGYAAEVLGLNHRGKDWHAVLVGSFPESAPAFELARTYREGEKSAAVVARVADGRYLEDVVEPPAPLERPKEPTQPYRAFLDKPAGGAAAKPPAAKAPDKPAAPVAKAPDKASEKAPTASSPALDNPDVRYVVQIGVFFLYTEAKGLESRFKETWKARITDYYEGNALWHVVEIGVFADRNEAASRAQAFMEKELRAATVKAVLGNSFVR